MQTSTPRINKMNCRLLQKSPCESPIVSSAALPDKILAPADDEDSSLSLESLKSCGNDDMTRGDEEFAESVVMEDSSPTNLSKNLSQMSISKNSDSQNELKTTRKVPFRIRQLRVSRESPPNAERSRSIISGINGTHTNNELTYSEDDQPQIRRRLRHKKERTRAKASESLSVSSTYQSLKSRSDVNSSIESRKADIKLSPQSYKHEYRTEIITIDETDDSDEINRKEKRLSSPKISGSKQNFKKNFIHEEITISTDDDVPQVSKRTMLREREMRNYNFFNKNSEQEKFPITTKVDTQSKLMEKIIRSSSESEDSICHENRKLIKPTTGALSEGATLFNPNDWKVEWGNTYEFLERQYFYRPIVKRILAGHLTNTRFIEVEGRIRKALSELHESSNKVPPDTIESSDPKILKTRLKPHQRSALAWMKWREMDPLVNGGILADEMGLGKTLSAISLITDQLKEEHDLGPVQDEKREEIRHKVLRDRGLVDTRATLVITPASLVYQWQQEFQKHTKDDCGLKIVVYHDQNRTKDQNKLRKAHVVLTTYGVIRSECEHLPTFLEEGNDDEAEDNFLNKVSKGAKAGKENKRPTELTLLQSLAWRRIVLDEAHTIKNHNSATSKAVGHLPAFSRWCLTGTPIQNKIEDLYSYVRFLRFAPFAELAVWKQKINNNKVKVRTNEEGGDQLQLSDVRQKRLRAFSNVLILRREKGHVDRVTGNKLVPLPDKHIHKHEVHLTDMEKLIYHQFHQEAAAKVKEMVEMNDVCNPFIRHNHVRDANIANWSCLLVMLLRLRQATTHFSLVKDAISIEDLSENVEHNIKSNEFEMALNISLLDSLNESISRNCDQDTKKQISMMFLPNALSTKLKLILLKFDDILSNQSHDKVIFVSQWTNMLNIVDSHLKKRGIQAARIDGKTPVSKRQDIVSVFNDPRSDVRVLCLSMMAGGVGLNLCGANHMFIADMHWNPSNELQASDRIHRIGQLKSVHIHQFVALETIDDRVYKLQQQKLELAQGILDGTELKRVGKLTFNDLKFLFDIDQPKDGSLIARGKQQQQPTRLDSDVPTSSATNGKLLSIRQQVRQYQSPKPLAPIVKPLSITRAYENLN